VYLYSQDENSAYQAADRMVLARVPQEKITEPAAYEYFTGFHDGQPRWSHTIADRGAVFTHPARCYRSGISYNPFIKRYLWCQILPPYPGERGPRFEGGFGIYEAPEPWGPWRTVFFTPRWDTGPGETASLPPRLDGAGWQRMASLLRGGLLLGSPPEIPPGESPGALTRLYRPSRGMQQYPHLN
jgi:hypothetical protein